MRHHGKDGDVFMSDTATGEAQHVGSLDNWDLDMGQDEVDTTSFQDANKQAVLGHPNLKFTFAGNWDETVKIPWKGRKSVSGVKVILYPNKTALPTKFASGMARISMKISASATGKVAISGSGVAAGDWNDTFGDN